MTNYLRFSTCIIVLLLSIYHSAAQTVIDPSTNDPDYEARKMQAITPGNSQANKRVQTQAAVEQSAAVTNAGCFIPRDSSYIAVPRNDDGSFGPVALPFSYNLYGNLYNQVYINTNGNLTFTAALGEYNASGFPISTPMVAGFWADVDTRNTGGGQIYYKVSPTNLIVTWDSVGYYVSSIDKLNTFQIIITNGLDPIAGIGNNTAFYYKDMQWTTGSASGGSDGFGGTPATVGINKGDAINYIQIGRFNTNASTYDGPGGAFDGVNYLDVQCFPFNVNNNAQNIPPSVSGIQPGDIISLNVGDTVYRTPRFIGPEVNQTVTTVVDTGTLCHSGYTVTNGAVSQVNFYVIGDTCNIGSHQVTFTATDNGIPVLSTTVPVTIIVNKLNQLVSFAPLSNHLYGDPPFKLSATTSSGRAVVYAVNGPAVIVHDTLRITGAGMVTVTASQPGDSVYNAAMPVVRSFSVAKAFQTVTFDSIPAQSYGQPYITLSATSSSRLPVAFNVLSGFATIDGKRLTPTGAGTIVVQALQPGNQNYQPASATRTFCISPIQPLPIQGFTEACVGILEYKIEPIPGITYTWSLSGGGTLSSTTGSAVTVNWTTIGTYTLTVKATTGCTTDTVQPRTLAITVTNALVPGAPHNMYPANGTVIFSLPFSCSWQPGTHAQLYDVYIWPDSTTEPVNATIRDITQIGTLINRNNLTAFAAGKKYNWRVVARNGCEKTAGEVQTFVISELPDVVVQNIQAPASPFSGQFISVTYEIKNTGREGSRSASWFDGVYLSADTILNTAIDMYLGAKPNVSALNPGQAYQNTIKGKLPEDIIGNQYLLVKANYNNQLTEAHIDNNITAIPIQINLTPPPDLQVTNVVTTGDAFSGDDITIQYTVKNKGTGDTKVTRWQDEIYISPDSTLNINAAIRLAGFTYNKGAVLKVDSSYTNNITVTLPDRDFGTYYIYVVTDAGKQVFEFVFENNNIGKSDPLNIFLTPPPDLVPVAVNNPAEASVAESIQVDWDVQNEGASKPRDRDKRWTDAVYISKDTVFNRSSAWLLASKAPAPYPVLNPGELYSNSATVTIPANFKDTCYVYVVTDVNDVVYEYLNENNNSRRSTIHIKTPDLSITGMEAPATGSSGKDLVLGWTVKNEGAGKVPAHFRADVIWLSTSAVFNTQSATNVGQVTYNNPMDPGASVFKQLTVKLPNGIAGTYYLFIETDQGNSIYEGGVESNNRIVSGPIQITLSPWPDLQVTSVAFKTDSIVSEKTIGFAYTVTNKGTSDLDAASWNDQVYLSKDSVWNSSRVVLLKTINRTQLLAQNESYEVNDSVFVSMNLLRSAGVNNTNCYLYVFTDAGNAIYEYNVDTNNTGRSNAVYAHHAEHTDFVMTSVSMPDSLASGKQATVAWSVINKGGVTGYYGDYWYDGIYVSQDTLFDGDDAFIMDKVLYSPLNKEESYSDKLTFTVPEGLSGDYYLLMVADEKNLNRDQKFSDNYKTITASHGSGEPNTPQTVHITLTPSPDLTVPSFSNPFTGSAGQPIFVKWKVTNLGPAVANGGWTERFYLSTDDKADGNDKVLGSYVRKNDLDSGAVYEDSMEVFVPAGVAGNFYVLLKTDNNNNLYEHNGEENNVAAGTIFIIQPDPSDLVVTNVTAPSLATFGDSVLLGWTVTNQGDNPASGRMQEGIYLSRDSIWSNDDVLVATVNENVMLSPGDTVRHTHGARINGVAAGNYFAIVRTDLADNIFEQNEDNNTGASPQPVSIAMPELPLNVITANVLKNNQDLYYRLNIPDSLAGNTILLSLKGDSAAGANELYIKYGDIPTRAGFDLSYNRAVSGNQEIVIPAAAAGSYYILAYGAVAGGTQQAITLLAKQVNFEILTIAANQGGNTGSVTVKVNGAKFESGMQVSLYDTNLGTVTAHTVNFVNSTTLFASFNLSGITTGIYDVKLKKINNDSTFLANAFTIVPGSGGSVNGGGGSPSGGGFFCNITNVGVGQLLDVNVQFPDATRTRRVFPMTINFGNSSNVDIPVPTRIMLSLGGDPISVSTEGIAENKNELYIEFKELNGPADVLRPGATGSITIFTISNTGSNLRFKLIE